MKNNFLLGIAITFMALASNSNAQITIQNIDIRSNGVFGDGADDPVAGIYLNHAANTGTSILLNGGPVSDSRTANDPTEFQMTYSNLDLDGDTTANDAVTFTLRWEKVDFDGDGIDGGNPAAFGQGIDTGFGNLNDLELSVVNVTGTTTDSGSQIFFDGFTGAGLGAGAGGASDVDRTTEVNGTTITFESAATGSFQFSTQAITFPLSPTVTFDNSGDSNFDGLGDGGAGSIVARTYDMQFSLTPPMMGGLKGDVNLDGSVTFLDINPFIMVLAANMFQVEADCDCDGDVDFLDIQPFINILAGIPPTP